MWNSDISAPLIAVSLVFSTNVIFILPFLLKSTICDISGISKSDAFTFVITLKNNIINAINKLSDVQKRRIKMYYFEELNLEQIAKIEHTSFQMISKSIKQGIENLKKILKNKI